MIQKKIYMTKLDNIIIEIAKGLSVKRALKIIYLFNYYSNNNEYKKGDRFRYDNDLYEVLVDHISNSKIPDLNNGLYKKCLW